MEVVLWLGDVGLYPKLDGCRWFCPMGFPESLERWWFVADNDVGPVVQDDGRRTTDALPKASHSGAPGDGGQMFLGKTDGRGVCLGAWVCLSITDR